MPCYRPMRVWQYPTGRVFFGKRPSGTEPLQLPCGQCIGCRLERSRQWAVRCMHEASMWSSNVFVTLTYDDDHLPVGESLHYPDFQLFMKRLRKRLQGVDTVDGKRPIRFYMCGEYGDQLARPHYHALLFNCDFPDKEPFFKSPSGSLVYRSDLLEDLWPLGHSSIGEVTFESAAYVARYCVKRVTGELAEDHYEGRQPEISRMSLRPGVGYRWIDRWYTDVYPLDRVLSRGRPAKPPRYYDKLYTSWCGREWIDVAAARKERALEDYRVAEELPVRRRARERCAQARYENNQRTI